MHLLYEAVVLILGATSVAGGGFSWISSGGTFIDGVLLACLLLERSNAFDAPIRIFMIVGGEHSPLKIRP